MRTTRRLLTSALVFALACGGPTGPEPEPEPTGTPSLAIVSGDNQTVQVTDTLPFDAEVCATRGGEPVADQLMDWKVLEDGAGEPFVTTTQTGPDGCTGNRVIAGTRAHTHPELDGQAHMEVRWIEQTSGEAIVEETIAYLVMPSAATSWPGDGYSTGSTGTSVTYPPATDQYGNPSAQRVVVSSIDSFPRWDGAASETVWVHRPSSDVVNVSGSDPWTRVARTIEDVLDPSEAQYAVVCLRAGTVDADSLVGVGMARTGPNEGIHLETHWGRDDFKPENTTLLLEPEHCR